MKARVAIARAFVTAPDLVLLDEPFAALDLGLRRELQTLMRTLVEETGVAALFVTHDLTEAVRLADIWQAAADLAKWPEMAAISARRVDEAGA